MRETSPLSDVFSVNSYVLLKPPEGARDSCEYSRLALILWWELIGISTPSRTYLHIR
jgi:hypothetical protein